MSIYWPRIVPGDKSTTYDNIAAFKEAYSSKITEIAACTDTLSDVTATSYVLSADKKFAWYLMQFANNDDKKAAKDSWYDFDWSVHHSEANAIAVAVPTYSDTESWEGGKWVLTSNAYWKELKDTCGLTQAEISARSHL